MDDNHNTIIIYINKILFILSIFIVAGTYTEFLLWEGLNIKKKYWYVNLKKHISTISISVFLLFTILLNC